MIHYNDKLETILLLVTLQPALLGLFSLRTNYTWKDGDASNPNDRPTPTNWSSVGGLITADNVIINKSSNAPRSGAIQSVPKGVVNLNGFTLLVIGSVTLNAGMLLTWPTFASTFTRGESDTVMDNFFNINAI